MQRGVAPGQRQREQQPRDELRRDRPVDFGLSALDRAADLDGEESPVVADPHAQPAERFEHHLHRAAQQRAAPLDGDGCGAERCHGREKTCREARFADVEHAALRGQSAFDRERCGVDPAHPRAERLDTLQGGTRVVAEFDVAQHRNLLREQCRCEGTLCIAFRTGRRQRAFDAARRNRFIHIYSLTSCPLRFFISCVS